MITSSARPASLTMSLAAESDAMADSLVAVENREREQDRAQLPGAEEERRRLRRGGRRAHGDPVAPLDAERCEQVGGAVGERALLHPAHARSLPRKSSKTIAGRSAGQRSQTSAAML